MKFHNFLTILFDFATIRFQARNFALLLTLKIYLNRAPFETCVLVAATAVDNDAFFDFVFDICRCVTIFASFRYTVIEQGGSKK